MGEHLEPPRKVKVIEQSFIEEDISENDISENEAAGQSLPVVRRKKSQRSRSPRVEVPEVLT
jgi:hypothetical protein